MGLLAGKVAVITGAGRGQGHAHAVSFARAGADILAIDVPHSIPTIPYELASTGDLARTAHEVEAVGRRIITASADVRVQSELDAAVHSAYDLFGRVDICVANAGVWSIAPFWEMTDAQWTDVLDVNLSGVWRTAKAVAPYMIAQRAGAIVVTASVNAYEAGKYSSHYVASKHGLLGLMRTIALELAPYGVRCNAVSPGAVDTPMVNWQGAYDAFAGHVGGTREDYVEASRRYHSLPGDGPLPPSAIADAALWLVSDYAASVTGTDVLVDAGHSLLPKINQSRGPR